MNAISKSPALLVPAFAQAVFEAVQEITNPRAAHRRRKAARLCALAKGREALARLKEKGNIAEGRPVAPHLAAAISAIETLEAAVLSLDAISNRLRDARELVTVASDASGADDGSHQPVAPSDDDTPSGARALLAERYDELRDDIDRIASTAYAGRINLLDGLGGILEVPLDGTGRSRAAITGANVTCTDRGLALPPPEQAFATHAERLSIGASVDAAMQMTAALAARFEVEAALLAARIRDLSVP